MEKPVLRVTVLELARKMRRPAGEVLSSLRALGMDVRTEDAVLNLSWLQDLTRSKSSPKVILSEKFGTAEPESLLPRGWSCSSSNPAYQWKVFGTASSADQTAGGECLFFDSGGAGKGSTSRAILATPLDLSHRDLLVSFDVWHETSPVTLDRIWVQVSTNGGFEWQNVGQEIFRADGERGWRRHVVEIEKFIGSSASVCVALRAISDQGAPLRVRHLELATYSSHMNEYWAASMKLAEPAGGDLEESNGKDTASIRTSPSTKGDHGDSNRPHQRNGEQVLFSWLHLSDVHFGHHDASHRWDQVLVLDALRKDIGGAIARGAPQPGAVLLTGDIAFSGLPEQYVMATTWILDLARGLNLDKANILLVPGNHDVDRSVDQKDRSVKRLVRDLRDGKGESLDGVLEHAEDRKLLTSRMEAFLEFAAHFPGIQEPCPLFWSHSIPAGHGFRIRVVGLNTALLSADHQDQGKLRLGMQAIARTLTSISENELVIVLTHHPLRDGWLADQRNAEGYVRSKAHIHLSGHIHETNSETVRSGAGHGLICVSAGAVHGDRLPVEVPAGHGYNMASVVRIDNGSLWLRVWPRRWSQKNSAFVSDPDNVPEGTDFAEHSLT